MSKTDSQRIEFNAQARNEGIGGVRAGGSVMETDAPAKAPDGPAPKTVNVPEAQEVSPPQEPGKAKVPERPAPAPS